MKYLLTITLLCSVAPLHAQEERGRHILGGIDIPSLSTSECLAINYQPVDVFDAPHQKAKKIGSIILDNPQTAQKTQDSCLSRPTMQFKPLDKKEVSTLQTTEISYEHETPAVYEVKQQGSDVWFKLQAYLEKSPEKKTDFWIKNKNWKYLTYENDLVQGIALIPEICDKTLCKALSTQMQSKIQNLDRPDSCYGNLYDITGPVTMVSGKKVYPVKMAKSLEKKFSKIMPKVGYVPVYTSEGSWTGFYYSRGC